MKSQTKFNKHGIPSAPETKTFTFRLKGHDQDLPVGAFEAYEEARAFSEAFKHTKRFELPGWTLYCVETGTSLPVVKLMGYKDEDTLLPYEAKKGKRISKRV